MAEPKPLASLTSGLLARKGAAQPAMRRPVAFLRAEGSAALQDDLGWNDMGFDVTQPEPLSTEARPATGLTPMSVVTPMPPVVTERKQLAAKLAKKSARSAAPSKTPAIAVSSGRKAAFTLRLDSDRHLKLRLASAVDGRSAQQIVTEALDQFLGGLPEIDRLAQQLPRKSSKN